MTIIATIAIGLLGVGVALFAVLYQVKSQRKALGVEILLKLVDTFFKDMKKEERCIAVNVIPDIRGGEWHGDKDEVEDVLDFFDFVGALARKGILDKELVWHEFFYWIYGYYDRTQDHIKEYQRTKATVVWEDLSWLYQELIYIERGKRGEIDAVEWKDFVDEEKKICGV